MFIRLCPNWLKSATFHLSSFDCCYILFGSKLKASIKTKGFFVILRCWGWKPLKYATVDRSKEAVCGIEEEKVSKDKVSKFQNVERQKSRISVWVNILWMVNIGEKKHLVRSVKRCRMRGWKWPWHNVKVMFLIKVMAHRFHRKTAITYNVSTSWSTGEFQVGISFDDILSA